MTKFDPTKPVQTRDGRKAEIVRTDFRSRIGSILALIDEADGTQSCCPFYDDGSYAQNSKSRLDLINIPVKHKRTLWVNCYEHTASKSNRDSLSFHDSREKADSIALSHRLACKEITIEFEEGEGL